jgi:hypothetical protein
MKIIYCILLLLPGFCLAQPLSEQDTRLAIGRKELIHSALLNEDREV